MPREPPSCCSTASAPLKLYQAFIFSVPVFFTFVLLFLFYLFYLRRQQIDWSSFQVRTLLHSTGDDFSRSEFGLKKEFRELLPVIKFKESFSIKDTQCSVCLGDYQTEDRLQQLPGCGHTFHMECIDRWLSTHTTCPLCRLSLLASARSTETCDILVEVGGRLSNLENGSETSFPDRFINGEETPSIRRFFESRVGDGRIDQRGFEGDAGSPSCNVGHETQVGDERNENEPLV